MEAFKGSLTRRDFLAAAVSYGTTLVWASSASSAELIPGLNSQEQPIAAGEISDIPGLRFETYRANFPDITASMLQQDLTVYRRDLLLRVPDTLSHSGRAFFGTLRSFIPGSIPTADHPGMPGTTFYHELTSDAFYSTIGADGQDLRLLGWPVRTTRGIFASVSSAGRVIYNAVGWSSRDSRWDRYAAILADIPNSTLTFLQDIQRPDYQFNHFISDDGSVLAVSFLRPEDDRHGTYFINAADWTLKGKLGRSFSSGSISKSLGSRLIMNGDGSKVYFPYDEAADVRSMYKTSRIHDLSGNVLKKISWPTFLSRGPAGVISPDFNFIASNYGMFAAASFIPGQFGTMVRTPDGKFILINSAKNEANLYPTAIDDDGTLYTMAGYKNTVHVFKYDQGQYRLFRAWDDKEIDIRAVQVG